jgi:hypothetical protein
MLGIAVSLYQKQRPFDNRPILAFAVSGFVVSILFLMLTADVISPGLWSAGSFDASMAVLP